MTKTYIIAEAGSTHDGSLEKAEDMVYRAAASGASAIKFQYWSDSGALATRRKANKYLDVYRKYQMPKEWLDSLERCVNEVCIDFMCTTYLPEDIGTVAPYVAKYKVASFEALDTNFILDHVGDRKDIIVSAGMLNDYELRRLLGLRGLIPELKVLHCVSAYPTDWKDLNLRVIRRYGLDGFSDHTADTETGMVAVVAGARILEVHVRHDETNPSNPDYKHSLTFDQLKRYIGNVEDAELALGFDEKGLAEGEREMAQYRVGR